VFYFDGQTLTQNRFRFGSLNALRKVTQMCLVIRPTGWLHKTKTLKAGNLEHT